MIHLIITLLEQYPEVSSSIILNFILLQTRYSTLLISRYLRKILVKILTLFNKTVV